MVCTRDCTSVVQVHHDAIHRVREEESPYLKDSPDGLRANMTAQVGDGHVTEHILGMNGASEVVLAAGDPNC
jgi:hypothetical protein